MRFNGATAFEPWNQPVKRQIVRLELSFNGATAFEPWNQAAGAKKVTQATSFNGATAFEPWNRCSCSSSHPPLVQLQWGHGI